jgi:hypothetical protein
MNVKLLKFNIFFEKPYIEGLFRSNSSWKLQYRECVGFFTNNFHVSHSTVHVHLHWKSKNEWILELFSSPAPVFVSAVGGEGAAAAAETYKSRRVGGPERRVYIGGNIVTT